MQAEKSCKDFICSLPSDFVESSCFTDEVEVYKKYKEVAMGKYQLCTSINIVFDIYNSSLLDESYNYSDVKNEMAPL